MPNKFDLPDHDTERHTQHFSAQEMIDYWRKSGTPEAKQFADQVEELQKNGRTLNVVRKGEIVTVTIDNAPKQRNQPQRPFTE
jgi:hypothetical protein